MIRSTESYSDTKSNISRVAPPSSVRMNLLAQREKTILQKRKEKLDKDIASHRYERKNTLNQLNSSNFHLFHPKEEVEQIDENDSVSETEIKETGDTSSITSAENKIGQIFEACSKRATIENKRRSQQEKVNDQVAEETSSTERDWNDNLLIILALIGLIICLKQFAVEKGYEHPLLINIAEINAIISFLINRLYRK